MFKVGKLEFNNALLLAPMEEVTDISYRIICKRFGADIVYTEFINTEGLRRNNPKTHKKMALLDEERPVAIQIYGGNPESMIEGAKIAESENPEFIDINAGCWVKNVVGHGAGAGLLKDPCGMQTMVGNVVKAVSLPVTVKTRIGWDENSVNILEVAKRLEDVGVAALTVHCRPRSQGHRGEPDWSWIPKVKEVVSMPVAVNGGVFSAADCKRAFDETGADAVMIARGAIGMPWIFAECKELLTHGEIKTIVSYDLRIKACLNHLALAVELKGERRGVLEHRKFYSGYLKGLRNVSQIRAKLMTLYTLQEVTDVLLQFLEELNAYEEPFTETPIITRDRPIIQFP